MQFSQQQLQIRNLVKLDVLRQACAYLQGQGLPTLKLELLIFQLNRYRKTEFSTLLQGIRVQCTGTDAD